MATHDTSSQKKKTKKKSKKTTSGSPSKTNSLETLHDAFIHELSDMHNGEQQLTKALPKMAKAAADPELQKAFQTHFEETEQQIKLIGEVVKSLDIKLKTEKCDAMEGLVEEGKDVIKNVKSGPVRDVLLIAAAQKVEHYEIASYGCLVTIAKQLGFTEAANVLEQILAQEKMTDEKLNQLAEQGINEEASMQDPTQKGNTKMARYDREENNGRRGRMPERDEDGRFMSDNDRSNNRGGYYGDDRYSSRDDEDDNRRYSRSSRNEDYGNNDNYLSSRRDYNDDYDDRSTRSGNRGNGGWFGDSEGHSEAARQRGRNSGNRSSSSYDDDNDDRYSSRSGNSMGRSESRSEGSSSRGSGSGRGWFGDSEGHARAGRHSHDNYRSNGRR